MSARSSGRGAASGAGQAAGSAGPGTGSGLPMSKQARLALSRAGIARAVSQSQRPSDVPVLTGSDHLPEKYDRDAVQVALDSIVARLYEGALQEKRDG